MQRGLIFAMQKSAPPLSISHAKAWEMDSSPTPLAQGSLSVQLFPSWKNATALAAATFRESTPWVMGIFTV